MSRRKNEVQQKLDNLLYLVDNDQIPEFKREIEANPGLPRIAGTSGNTIFCLMIQAQRLDLAQWLLEKGADVNGHAGALQTPLQDAIDIGRRTGSYEMLRFLLDHCADTELRGFNTWTALHTACAWGAGAAAEVLLERGADVNTRSLIDGAWTPLMDAAAAGHEDVVVLLLRHGARTDIRCEFTGQTAKDLARANGCVHVVRELENWSSRSVQPDDPR